MKTFRVVLGLSHLTVPQKIEFARAIVKGMTGNANFTTPNPTLATISTNASALETAYLAQQTGAAGLTTITESKAHTLDLSLNLLAAYVEGIANANPATAEAIILSSNMHIRKPAPPRVNGFRIKATGNPARASVPLVRTLK